MSALCPLNHAIAAFATANVAIVSNSIKGRRTGRGAHPPAGGNPAFAGRAGRSTGRVAKRAKNGESAKPPPDRADDGKRKRSSGAGAGGGGEHSAPARAHR